MRRCQRHATHTAAAHGHAVPAVLAPLVQVVHGSEPAHTWPSGIRAPLMDEGDPHCADYVYAWQAGGVQLTVAAAALCGDVADEADATLYPSDHLGIRVKLRVAAVA